MPDESAEAEAVQTAGLDGPCSQQQQQQQHGPIPGEITEVTTPTDRVRSPAPPSANPLVISWAVDVEDPADVPLTDLTRLTSLPRGEIRREDLLLQEEQRSQRSRQLEVGADLPSSLKTSEAWSKPASATVAFAASWETCGLNGKAGEGTHSSRSPRRPTKETTVSSGSVSVQRCCVSPATMRRIRRRLRWVVRSRSFQATTIIALVVALFGGNFWILCEIPDEPGILILDAIMSIIFVLFVLEMVFLSIAERRTYMWSFFFWMDLLGSASMIFEISFLLGTNDELTRSSPEVDTTLMRTARATKVGARVGRLTKLTKFIKWMSSWAGKRYDVDKHRSAAEQASAMSKQVMLHLSVKVALLSIVLIIFVPLFSLSDYPQEDWSLRAWSQRIEKEYRSEYDRILVDTSKDFAAASAAFSAVLQQAVAFYDDMNYHPYKVEGYRDTVTIRGESGLLYDGPDVFHGTEPDLNNFIIRQEVPNCLLERPSCSGGSRAVVFFNARGPTRLKAAMDMLMIVFIIVVMLGVTFDLSRTIHRMLMMPLERLLAMVRSRARGIFDTVCAVHKVRRHASPDARKLTSIPSGDSVDLRAAALSELEMLQKALEKLAIVGNLLVQDEVVDKITMDNLDQEGKGIIVEILRMGNNGGSSAMPGSRTLAGKDTEPADSDEQPEMMCQPTSSYSFVRLPVHPAVLESWELDTLSLDGPQAVAIIQWVLFSSPVGERSVKQFLRKGSAEKFLSVVESSYQDQPYHNFTHACDVCHTVYRLLSEVHSDSWLSASEQYALLLASVCHDIGHPGRTNIFLVQTRDPLAMLYNDKSPLENMHCARLFEIGLDQRSNIFEPLPKDTYKDVRKVCISTILHTDNAHHFQMVKDISRVYEVAQELCEAQVENPQQFTNKFIADVLKKDSLLWLKLFLHLADVSNPMKPFPICKSWAWRVLDEFFNQGDEEKKLGLPVGMLNDRNATNRPGSQHGFIIFLVAPLVRGSVRIFPTLHPLTTQMARNLADWQKLWEEDAKPSGEDIAKRTLEVQKVKEQAEELALQSYADGTMFRIASELVAQTL